MKNIQNNIIQVQKFVPNKSKNVVNKRSEPLVKKITKVKLQNNVA